MFKPRRIKTETLNKDLIITPLKLPYSLYL
jgi:hypothetical protein